MWKSLMVGVGIGYVLGAKAGRERYEQIAGAARTFSQSPRVQEAADRARQQAGVVAGRAVVVLTDRVGERIPSVLADRVPLLQRRPAEDDSWGTYRP